VTELARQGYRNRWSGLTPGHLAPKDLRYAAEMTGEVDHPLLALVLAAFGTGGTDADAPPVTST
jgi:hypothetical protein